MNSAKNEFQKKIKDFRNIILGNWSILMGIVFLVYISKSIVLNSGISFDFENVFRLSKNSFLAVFFLLLLTVFHFSISYKASKIIKSSQPSNVEKAILIAIAGFLIVPFIFLLSLQNILVPLLIAGFIYLTLLDLFLDVRTPNLTWLISWMIVLSVFITIVLFKYNSDLDFNKRVAFIETLFKAHEADDVKLIQKNLDQTNLLAIETFLVDQLTQQEITRERINEVVDTVFDKEFNEKYETEIFAFDDFGNSLISNQYALYEDLFNTDIYTAEAGDKLFYDGLSSTYFYTDKEKTEGAPQLGIKVKTKDNDNILGKNNQRFTRNPTTPAFSIHRNNKILYSNHAVTEVHGQIPLTADIGTTTHEIINGKSSIWFRYNNEVFIHSQKPVARLIKPISLFSYTFTLFGIFIILIAGINSFTKIFPPDIKLRLITKSSLRNKLQVSLISLFIISFMIIGFVTLFYFKNLNLQYDNELISEKTTAITNELASILADKKDIRDTRFHLFSSAQGIATKHMRDILVFNENGDLVTSSVSANPINMPLSEETVGYLKNQNNPLLIKESKSEGFTFKTSFIPISLEKQFLGFVGIQHSKAFQSQYSVHDIIGTLLNVYVFLFLIAGALAFAVSNSITRPISELGEKLKKLKLGKRNEVLEWNSQDELGELIKNYNAMVIKLEESAQLIAKTERDHAWREMAKQVAHEIKNPLTPMKLSIQYLQKAIESRPEEAESLIKRVSGTLIEQIDNLSQIASAFSHFGKMPIADNQKIVVNEIVEAIHDLFRKREDMDINLYVPIDEVYVFADKNQLIRILNNIVKNAIQAIPTDKRGKIDIYLKKNSKNAVIKISDNGVGIPDDMRSKVFRPNFTTKSSGTGLGLAMAANMIESFNGKIYFETTPGDGSDFFIELPLMHVNDNYKNESRVLLE